MDKIRTRKNTNMQKTFKQKPHRNYSFPLLEKENLMDTIILPASTPPYTKSLQLLENSICNTHFLARPAIIYLFRKKNFKIFSSQPQIKNTAIIVNIPKPRPCHQTT